MPLDLLVLPDQEVLLELVDFLVFPDVLAQWACPVPVVLLDPVVPVDPLETLAVLVSPVRLDPEVSPEALAALDPQERRALLVPLDKMAAPDPLAQLDPEDRLVLLDSLDLRDLVVSPVRLERRDPLDLLV